MSKTSSRYVAGQITHAASIRLHFVLDKLMAPKLAAAAEEIRADAATAQQEIREWHRLMNEKHNLSVQLSPVNTNSRFSVKLSGAGEIVHHIEHGSWYGNRPMFKACLKRDDMVQAISFNQYIARLHSVNDRPFGIDYRDEWDDLTQLNEYSVGLRELEPWAEQFQEAADPASAMLHTSPILRAWARKCEVNEKTREYVRAPRFYLKTAMSNALSTALHALVSVKLPDEVS